MHRLVARDVVESRSCCIGTARPADSYTHTASCLQVFNVSLLSLRGAGRPCADARAALRASVSADKRAVLEEELTATSPRTGGARRRQCALLVRLVLSEACATLPGASMSVSCGTRGCRGRPAILAVHVLLFGGL